MEKIKQIQDKLQILQSQLTTLLEIPQPGSLHLPLALLSSITLPPPLLVYPNSLPSDFEINTLLRSKLPVEFDVRYEITNDMDRIADLKHNLIQELELEDELKRSEVVISKAEDENLDHLLTWMASGE
jgi:hypothetical protein